MIQFFTPSNNENKMREDLPIFEDFKVLQDGLKPQHEDQNFKTQRYFFTFRYFSTVFHTFQIKNLIHQMKMKLILIIIFKKNQNSQLILR